VRDVILGFRFASPQALCCHALRALPSAEAQLFRLHFPVAVHRLFNSFASQKRWFTSRVIPAGYSLRVVVASAPFPKYDFNLNTGGDNERDTR